MLEFFYLLNALLLPRLFLFFRDKPVSLIKIILLSIVNLLSFFIFSFNVALLLFASFILITNVGFYLAENNTKDLNLIRFLSFLWLVILSGFFTGDQLSLKFNFEIVSYLTFICKSFSFLNIFRNIAIATVLKILAGGLILINEINFAIRFLFKALDLVPQKNHQPDEKEYNTGRVIGLLERMLIYFFALSNQYTGIGFIIAAKGIIRFKGLDDKSFSEYVLIGTFLSTIFSLIVAYLVMLAI